VKSSVLLRYENLDSAVCIKGTQRTHREKNEMPAKESLGYYELKKHKQWFGHGCSKLLDEIMQTKLLWLSIQAILIEII
jgi:hypothetical protein